MTPSAVHRFADHVLPLVARHARHQKLAPADCFWKFVKSCAVSDEIRPHRHDDVDRQLQRVCCRQKQANKGRCLIPTLGSRLHIEAALKSKVSETEQFLELIDEQQNAADFGFP